MGGALFSGIRGTTAEVLSLTCRRLELALFVRSRTLPRREIFYVEFRFAKDLKFALALLCRLRPSLRRGYDATTICWELAPLGHD